MARKSQLERVIEQMEQELAEMRQQVRAQEHAIEKLRRQDADTRQRRNSLEK